MVEQWLYTTQPNAQSCSVSWDVNHTQRLVPFVTLKLPQRRFWKVPADTQLFVESPNDLTDVPVFLAAAPRF